MMILCANVLTVLIQRIVRNWPNVCATTTSTSTATVVRVVGLGPVEHISHARDLDSSPV